MSSVFDKFYKKLYRKAPSVLAALGHLPPTGAAKSLHVLCHRPLI